ncbi:Spy/CpxP family protein refolding chaperone [bacterium]|nr:Spy/CpxP family protein refolding chaperone [bacterium]
MDSRKKPTTRNSLTLSIALMMALLLALPATSFSWGPGKGQGAGDNFAQRGEEVKKSLNLDETQTKLWDKMKTGMQELRELCLKKGDNLNEDSRRRTMARNQLLMRAELAAETPDFKSVGEKLKAEYKGNFSAEFNKVIDNRVAFFNSLTQEQRDTMLKKGHRGHRRGGRGGKGKRNIM